MKWINLWIDALLGPETSSASRCEAPSPLAERAFAYLDPFENMNPKIKGPALYLKPQDIEQTLGMCEVLLNTSGIDALVIDSFFWLPGTTREFEQGIQVLMRAAKRAQKKICFLGPSNKMQDFVLANVRHNDLISFETHANNATLVSS